MPSSNAPPPDGGPLISSSQPSSSPRLFDLTIVILRTLLHLAFEAFKIILVVGDSALEAKPTTWKVVRIGIRNNVFVVLVEAGHLRANLSILFPGTLSCVEEEFCVSTTVETGAVFSWACPDIFFTITVKKEARR